ncbi:uncharacterized protein TNCV_1924011 [Trichonephila clavipes]|nr:uncharacterized protein TNCV_1924011 [Trichonephila clavipes]
MERLLKQPWRREPAGRRIREWPAPPGRSPAEDSGAGPPRGPALRHQQAAEGFPRMRLQDLGKVECASANLLEGSLLELGFEQVTELKYRLLRSCCHKDSAIAIILFD